MYFERAEASRALKTAVTQPITLVGITLAPP